MNQPLEPTVPFASALAAINSRVDDLLWADPLPAAINPAWLREAVLAYPRRGGKRLRPALTLWCCGLAGGDPERAWPAALAVELYHNWTLIHDDIIDGDATRRGRPACHLLLEQAAAARLPKMSRARRERFGHDQAILAGDILHGWSVAVLARLPGAVGQALVSRLTSRVTPLLISGEAQDVEYAYRAAVRPAEIWRMMFRKTGVLLQFAAEAGAMIGADTTDPRHSGPRRLGRLARQAGIAFQLRDDWLGLFGDEATLGKPAGSDLRAGKQTLLFTTALAALEAPSRRRLLQLSSRPDLSADELEEGRALVRHSHAEADLRRREERLIQAARAELLTFSDTPCRRLLADWLRFVCERTY